MRQLPGDLRRVPWPLTWLGIAVPLVVALSALVLLGLAAAASHRGGWLAVVVLAGGVYAVMAIAYVVWLVVLRRQMIILRGRSSAWRAVVAPLGVVTDDGRRRLADADTWSMPGPTPVAVTGGAAQGVAVRLTREPVPGGHVLVAEGFISDAAMVAAIAAGRVWPQIDLSPDTVTTGEDGVLTMTGGRIRGVWLGTAPAWPQARIWLIGE